MMTLDEAIKHAEKVAEEKSNLAKHIRDNMKSEIALSNADECETCADEHRQLVDWLKDYKRLKEQQPSEDCVSRAELKKWLDMNFSFGGALRKLEMFDRIDKELPPVIPTQSWIPMVRREPTEEEKVEHLAQNGEELCYIVENEMPLHGQEVLVSIGEYVSEDVFDEDFYNFESAELSDVDAWMPKPKAYKAERKSE